MKTWHPALIVTMLLSIILPTCKCTAGQGPECVVLLHGLARTERSLRKLDNHLKKRGYCVVNIGYPSRKKTIEELAETAIPSAIKKCDAYGAKKVHFVTHSMGGILVRYYLAHNSLPRLGRVVMLSPPNKGSQIVDKFGGSWCFKWMNGPAGRQLGTDKDSLPNKIGPPYYEVGIIAGDRTINFFLSLLIPGKDDGKVSIENAKLEGMRDFLIVHKSHPFIMNDPQVLDQVAAFIEKGAFTKQ